MRIAVV